MKVLYISHYDAMFGANKALYEIVNHVRKLEITPIVITSMYGDLNKALDELGIENYYIKSYVWVYNKNESLLRRVLKLIRKKVYDYFVIKKIEQICINKDIDIIHTNSSVIDIGAKVSLKINIPHIWHIREFGEEDYNLVYYNKIIKATRFMEISSESIIFISKILRKKYEQYFNDSRKISTIYDGVDENNYLLEEYQKNYEGKLKILFTGIIHKNKNQLVLVEAINHMVKVKKKKNIEVYFLGDGDKDYINEIKQYIIENDIEEYFRFEGKKSDIKPYLKMCHVGIMASSKEAFGRVTIEYMLGKMGVIASYSGANIELINENTGIFFELNNSKDLCEKIEILYDDRNKLKNLGESAYVEALDKYRLNISITKLNKLYKKIVNKNIDINKCERK